MGTVNAIKTMLERIGFTQAAVTLITGDRGVDSIDELEALSEEMANNLCRVIRRPGGTGDAETSDPGTKVSPRAEENLKLTIYYIKHQVRVFRDVVLGNITLSSIRKLINQRDTEKSHVDPETLPKIDACDWPKTIEAVEEYLRQFRGLNGVPLSYIVRKISCQRFSATILLLSTVR
uniref:Uncharacterized protein n=1 Tax=Eucampia antarctica TaxID=49252 RepID=A0A7S2SL59_9STRA|mmetsp:Transcript_982/g.905  ORF Transcript_982/g.905 Transcript_982/m.905 type:complete len:177 (+) Transcript_982:441-971(+)